MPNLVAVRIAGVAIHRYALFLRMKARRNDGALKIPTVFGG